MKKLTRREIMVSSAAAVVGAAASANAHPQVSVESWDLEVDVIVIGMGIAGGAAAVEAARSGAKVLVLDRGAAAVNGSHGGIFYMGGGTALQRSVGVDDDPAEMEKYLLASAGPAPDAERIRVLVERSPGDYDWLVSMGMPFKEHLAPGSDIPSGGGLYHSGNELGYPYRDIARPAPRGHTPAGVRAGWLQGRMKEEAKGAGATLMLHASAEQILTGADGSIEGVLAEVDGVKRSLRARRGVVLATGGFALNREMLANHAPPLLSCLPFDVSFNDGWGIRAGQEVGGQAIRMGAAALFWALYPPVSRKAGLLVNGQGQRFMAEDSYYGTTGNVIVNEQRGVAHLIVDAQALGKRPDYGGALAGRATSEIAAEADTIEELESALGIPSPGLQNTVAVYNDYASKGEDPLFHKAAEYVRPLEPPFTAVKASLGESTFAFFTLGGLHTSPRSEVLDREGSPIPKLYAAGRAAAGIPSLHSASYLSGLSLSSCLTFGRIAGINAAAT